MFDLLNGQNHEDIVRSLITAMTPMFVDAPEPRSDAVRHVLRRMETEILALLPEATELLTGHKH